ncbi:MAG: C-terminal binding protein [Thermoflexales bacterium]
MSVIERASANIVRLTGPIFNPGEFELKRFSDAGLSPRIVASVDPAELAIGVKDADVVVVVGTKIPASVVDAMARCRAIARFGTGTDKIDVAHATELGIPVVNTPFFCIEEMADHVMAMLLSLARNLRGAQRAFEAGDMAEARHKPQPMVRVSHTTLGLVGFGRSAVHTARRARGFGMRVLATRQNKNAPTTEADALGVIMTELDTVLRESDHVSLHIPLTPATYHLIDDAAIRKMKPTAVIINTSRGSLIDEIALAAAIREGRLGGAGIDTHGLFDVFTDHMPPMAHPLMGLDNVLITPHTAGGSIQASQDMIDVGVQNVIDILEGRWPPPENIVNPTVIPRFGLTRQYT